jgi:serine/threonine-protein phosphatase Stp1
MPVDCATRTHVGHRRKINEDAVLSMPEHGMWAVADGMGGHDAGEIASGMVVEALTRAAGTAEDGQSLTVALAALEAVNDGLIAIGRSSPEPQTIGSTVVGIIAADARYYCFWVGDSRAYRVRDGAILQLTRDHSLVQDLVDAGMIDAAEAEDHPNANVVTRAVGASERLEVETVSGDVLAGDLFLLASDGLTRLANNDELMARLEIADIELAAGNLLDLALARGAPDNVSLVVVRFR